MGGLCSKDEDEKQATRRNRYAASSTSGDAAGGDDALATQGSPQPARRTPQYRAFPGLFPEDVGATALAAGPPAAHDAATCFVGSEEGSIAHINVGTGAVLAEWQREHARDVNKLVYHAGTRALFSCSRDKTVRMRRLAAATAGDAEGFSDIAEGGSAGPSATFQGHSLVVTCIAVSPDGSRVFSGSRDNTVRLWDAATQAQLAVQDEKLNIVHSCAWIDTLGVCAQGGEDLTIRLWDWRAHNGSGLSLQHTIANFDYHPICMKLLNDGTGTTIVTGHNGFNGTGAMVTTWDLRMQRPLGNMTGHENTVRWVCVPDAPTRGAAGQQIFTASDDSTIREWQPQQRTEAASHRVHEGRLTTLEQLTDGTLAAACRSGTVVVLRHDPKGNALERHRHFGGESE